jgi:hypothetical protein
LPDTSTNPTQGEYSKTIVFERDEHQKDKKAVFQRNAQRTGKRNGDVILQKGTRRKASGYKAFDTAPYKPGASTMQA